MKVTPEIFAWFNKLNIISPDDSKYEQLRKYNIIPDNIISSMFLGKYFDILIEPLQTEYNRFYNREDNYIINLINLKEVPENQIYKSYAITNKVKYENWCIIFEILGHFGLNFTETELNLLVNNDKDELEQVIKKIYSTYLKFSKIQMSGHGMRSRLSILNIDEIDIDKNYDDCNTLLEFIIISIAKNMNLNARQSVALLSNNRKYLKKICVNGYIFDFQMIKNWLRDFTWNKELILDLINNSDDALNIFYETMGTVLYCNDLDISLQAAKLLNLVKNNIKMNWKWFYHEGINIFIFIFNKENSYYKKDFMKVFGNLIVGKSSFFFEEIKKKFYSGERKIAYDLLSNIINSSNDMGKEFTDNLRYFIYEICLSKTHDISFNLSMLSDTFYNFIPNDDKLVQKILSYFEYYIKGNTQNIFSTGILQMFNLMERLGKIKDKYAPHLYKIIVNLFLETYDNVLKREIFLDNFEKFFNENQDIPIDIFLEPYLEKLNNCQNYSLYDFLFLLKIVEHPRIEGKDISEIIQFILYVCLYNLNYTRCANLILNLIFEKQLITKNKNDTTTFKKYNISEIETQFVNFIQTALDIYLSNIFKKDDKYILETPYDIMSQNFEQLNIRIKTKIINSIKKYRKLKGSIPNELLALLWHYDDHDDIMMQMEEINRPVYEPMEKFLERKKIAKKQREEKSYTRKVINYLNNLSRKRWENARKQQELYDKKKLKEQKLKQKLREYRNFMSFIPSMESGVNPLIYSHSKFKLTRNNSRIFNNRMQNNIHIKSEQNFESNYSANKLIKSQSQPEFSIFEKNDINNIMKQYQLLLKSMHNKNYISVKTKRQWIKNILVRKEDTCKYQELYNKNRRYYLDKDIFIKYLSFPFDLDEEEDRDLNAIKGYNVEYKKNLIYYFKIYSNEVKEKISKIKLIRLLRDIGFDKGEIDFNEVNILIRLMFKYNLSEFDFNQFINLIVQLSYIIYSRFRTCLTIGESYGNFIKKFVINQINAKQIDFLNKKYRKVFDYILYLKREKEPFNMPEGFKIVKKTLVRYNYRLQNYMADYIGEPNLICYQIIEEIIFSVCQSSLIEPYVEVDDYETVEIEPEKIHNWSAGLTMAYMDLDKDLQFYGMFAADALEDGIRKMLRKSYEENIEANEMRYTKKIYSLKWVKEDIIKKRQWREKILHENEKKKIDKEPNYNKYKSNIDKSGYEIIKNKFKEIEKIIELKKIKKKEEIKAKEKSDLEKEFKKKEGAKNINKECGKKVRLQLLNIVEKKTGIRKEKKEEKKDEKSDKKCYKLEQSINNSIKNKMEKIEIKKIMVKYENHLKVIYDSFSKTTLDEKKVIQLDEFKQFLDNFSLIEECISSEQMNLVFNYISKPSQRKRNNKLYLDFDDFKLSICYLSLFSNFGNDVTVLNTKDINELNEECVEKFLKKLGLKFPFNKTELEKNIKNRKSDIIKLPKIKQVKINPNVKEIKIEENKANLNNNEEQSNESSANNNNNIEHKKEEENEEKEKSDVKKEENNKKEKEKNDEKESEESSDEEEEESEDDKKNKKDDKKSNANIENNKKEEEKKKETEKNKKDDKNKKEEESEEEDDEEEEEEEEDDDEDEKK